MTERANSIWYKTITERLTTEWKDTILPVYWTHNGPTFEIERSPLKKPVAKLRVDAAVMELERNLPFWQFKTVPVERINPTLSKDWKDGVCVPTQNSWVDQVKFNEGMIGESIDVYENNMLDILYCVPFGKPRHKKCKPAKIVGSGLITCSAQRDEPAKVSFRQITYKVVRDPTAGKIPVLFEDGIIVPEEQYMLKAD